jgi:hypothetical protein
VREDDLLEPEVPPDDEDERVRGDGQEEDEGLEPEEHIGLTPPD